MLAIGATHKHQIYRAALAQTRLRRLGSGTREPPADHWRPVCGPSTPHSAALISRMRITAALAFAPRRPNPWLHGYRNGCHADGCAGLLPRGVPRHLRARHTCGMHLGPAHCRREDGRARCPRVDATRMQRGLSPPVAGALARAAAARHTEFLSLRDAALMTARLLASPSDHLPSPGKVADRLFAYISGRWRLPCAASSLSQSQRTFLPPRTMH